MAGIGLKSDLKKRNTAFNLLFLAPCVVIFGLLILLPLAQAVPYSLWRWDGYSAQHEFVGLANYITLLRDKDLLRPIWNTFVFTVVYVIASNMLGLLIALLLQRTTRYTSLLRTVFFIPFVLSMLLAAFIFSYIYSDVFYALFGIKSLLGNIKTVNYAIAAIAIWKDTGYCMILDLAALNLISREYYEAASIEGCGPVRALFKITIPLMVPAFTTNPVPLLTWGIQAFDYAMAATGGGPGNYSETLAMFVYKNIFVYHKAGYGAAAGMLLVGLLLAITVLATRLLRGKEVEL